MTSFKGTYESAVREFVAKMPRGSARRQAAKAMLAEIDRLRGHLASVGRCPLCPGSSHTAEMGHVGPIPAWLAADIAKRDAAGTA
jgi:hypothetical protein